MNFEGKIEVGGYKSNPTDYRCTCMNEIHRPKYKESCYFYDEVQDTNATIPTCDYFHKLGYCPCDICGKFIDKEGIFRLVKKMVDERIPEN